MAVRRLVLTLAAAVVLFCVDAPRLRAQNANGQKASQQDAAQEQSEFPWHLINSAIFAVALGYGIWKYSPAFFNARSEDIQKAIKDATGLKLQADFRHSEIDRKMATLPDEIRRMREESRVAMDREHQRRRDETQRELQHIQDSMTAEIAAANDDATRQIRRRTAALAIDSAERRLRERGPGGTGTDLVGDFIRLVERGKTR